MDCGFHGFSFESKIMNLDHFFLIRMKEGDSHSLLQIPKEYDINPEVDSTKKLILMKKPLKQYTGDALHYPLRGKDRSCLDANGEHPFSIRLVKIQAPAGSNSPEPFQYFITNLPESEYPIDDIQSLYKSRWEIETAFLDLKQSAGLQAVHARKIDSVSSHKEWKERFVRHRDRMMYLCGWNDEKNGNQLCRLIRMEDGSWRIGVLPVTKPEKGQDKITAGPVKITHTYALKLADKAFDGFEAE